MIENKFQLVREIGQGSTGSVWISKIPQFQNRQFQKRLSSYRSFRTLFEENIITFKTQNFYSNNALTRHLTGFVHRDLKPDNILLRSFDYSSPESSLISLIDFSASQSYLCENGQHVQNERQSTFNGNFVFSSIYQMLGHSPSRKDDLLSIFYLLLYLKDGSLPWVIKQGDGKIKQMSFDQVRKAKQDFHSLIKMKSQTLGYGLEQGIIKLVQQNGRIFRTIQVL
ncbi:isoform 2 of casein kinase i isoform delta [Stylonychia lemnae]|uniref:Casein kinase I n=1 Tax=Stylonychia lemnae TaxID=5949 RepID=A0A078AXS4_STYLE|nr:isoform 2 of casein kinase i isoform delta [Stylonychia lemnae]|eukprot:CDW86969.1 isoform 2 of casein kinase i isoform delta [Stylonychia lemnae]